MVNPLAGEVALVVDGTERRCKLTLGTLAELEAGLEDGSIFDLVARFENGAFRAGDVLALVLAGLRGGGWEVTQDELVRAEISGGPAAAAVAAAQMLARAFAPPGT